MKTILLKSICAGAALLLLAGCATMQPKPGAAPVDPAPPSIPYAEVAGRVFPGSPPPTPAPDNVSGVLTPPQVQGVARKQNPTFAEFAATRQAARAEVLQALAYPNPDLEVDLEYTVALFQPVEFPSKRKTRRKAAEATASVVDREEDVFRATLAADVAKAYFAVLYRDRAVAIARETLKTEQDIERIVSSRVEAGEAAESDRIKAQVETLKASQLVQAQERQRIVARSILNTLCGRALPPDFALNDVLEQPLAAADIEQARQIALTQHPRLRRIEAEVHQKELALKREQKAWLPSLRIGVPLGLEAPLWNRNKGGVAAAQADLEKAQAEQVRERQEIERDIETSAQAYESAREQLAAFQGGLRSAAAESLRIETLMYQEGEVDFLQLLDASRTARQTETEYLQAMYDAQIARVDIERAIGIGGDQE